MLAAAAVSAALLTPLVVVGGVGFAKSSPSAAQYQYGKKTTLCHRTHSKKHPRVTITVGNAAVPAHLRHGDTLGPCPTGTSSSANTGHNGDKGQKHGHGHDNGNGHHKGHGK